VNVWATWCQPCIEEIPRLHRWRAQLGDLPLVLVSVDESDQIVADYRKGHPEITSSARFADPAALPAWLKTLGLDEAAPIPIHVFVDAQGKTRCVRAGGVGEPDFAAVQKVVAER
jgi:thiol-disulfide isomerase/thioredoxin